MDIEQLQWEFKMLTSAEQHQFLEKHVEELREALGITHQMLIKDADAEEIITDLMDDHDMTVSDLLDIYGDIESVRDIVRWTTEDSYEDDY
jgi:hypothetical protein